MKNTFLFFILAIITSAFLTVSCQKELDSFTPETIDSIKSILPKQVIVVWGMSDTLIASIKYDTLNLKVEIYEDDPSTPDLFDNLALTYTFNNDGYLISYHQHKDISGTSLSQDESVNITRTSDNKISYIAYYDRNRDEKDTTFYNYKSFNGGTTITTVGEYSYFGNPSIYNYDMNNKLLSSETTNIGYDNFYQFSYNSNNSISKVVKTGAYFNNIANFFYTSGIPDDKEDMLYRILLGKDYYLWDLTGLSPFNIPLDPDYDNFNISITNPYHITRMQDSYQPNSSGNPSGDVGVNMLYELNQDKLLSKVTIDYDDADPEWGGGWVLVKY